MPNAISVEYLDCQKGQPNGIATLDENGKIPCSEIDPVCFMQGGNCGTTMDGGLYNYFIWGDDTPSVKGTVVGIGTVIDDSVVLVPNAEVIPNPDTSPPIEEPFILKYPFEWVFPRGIVFESGKTKGEKVKIVIFCKGYGLLQPNMTITKGSILCVSEYDGYVRPEITTDPISGLRCGASRIGFALEDKTTTSQPELVYMSLAFLRL